MNTTHSLVRTEDAHTPALVGSEAHRLLTVGQEFGWEFMVLGQAPMPTQPVRLGEWLIVPAELDSSPIPERALKRVQAIYAAGLRPKGFVLVHEAPLQLAAPARKPFDVSEFVERISPAVVDMLGKAVGAAALLALYGVLAAAFIVCPWPFLLIGLVMVDPILIAVTEDGDWIEIDRWNQ
jgi:hypothetical protein